MQITLDLNVHELASLQAAVSEYRTKWRDMKRDCDDGLRPGMDPVGAGMILEEVEAVMEKINSATNSKSDYRV